MPGTLVLPEGLQRFLGKEPAATLALPVNDAGDIHAASLLFWFDEITYNFYFVTKGDTEKCALLQNGNKVQAACVIGTSKGVRYSLQMRGHVRMVNPKQHSRQIMDYYQKRGNRNDDIDDAGSVLLAFTPTWIRCTDYTEGVRQWMLLE